MNATVDPLPTTLIEKYIQVLLDKTLTQRRQLPRKRCLPLLHRRDDDGRPQLDGDHGQVVLDRVRAQGEQLGVVRGEQGAGVVVACRESDKE